MAEKSLFDYDRARTGVTPAEGGEWKDGFCTICSGDKAPYHCLKCSSTVCSEHYVTIMGLCVDCAPVKDTGKTFKMAEPLTGRTETASSYTPVQQVAEAPEKKNIFTFGVEEPKDVRKVVRPSKNSQSATALSKSKADDKDVIYFERKKPSGVGSNDKDDDDETIDIIWV